MSKLSKIASTVNTVTKVVTGQTVEELAISTVNQTLLKDNKEAQKLLRDGAEMAHKIKDATVLECVMLADMLQEETLHEDEEEEGHKHEATSRSSQHRRHHRHHQHHQHKKNHSKQKKAQQRSSNSDSDFDDSSSSESNSVKGKDKKEIAEERLKILEAEKSEPPSPSAAKKTDFRLSFHREVPVVSSPPSPGVWVRAQKKPTSPSVP